MTFNIYIIIIFIIVLFMIISLSYKRGKDAESIKRLKEEIKKIQKEQEYANKKIDFINSLDSHAINSRLQDLAIKQRDNMRKS